QDRFPDSALHQPKLPRPTLSRVFHAALNQDWLARSKREPCTDLQAAPRMREKKRSQAQRKLSATTAGAWMVGSLGRLGLVLAVGSAALLKVTTASILRLPRISISWRGNSERASPARATVSSETTSSQSYSLASASSRLAVLTASPMAV